MAGRSPVLRGCHWAVYRRDISLCGRCSLEARSSLCQAGPTLFLGRCTDPVMPLAGESARILALHRWTESDRTHQMDCRPVRTGCRGDGLARTTSNLLKRKRLYSSDAACEYGHISLLMDLQCDAIHASVTQYLCQQTSVANRAPCAW
jgi:hypothetical protein